MSAETKTEELDERTQLTRFVISLIRAHYEPPSENSFLETSREVSKFMSKTGQYQLASYVDVLDGDDKNVWVPM